MQVCFFQFTRLRARKAVAKRSGVKVFAPSQRAEYSWLNTRNDEVLSNLMSGDAFPGGSPSFFSHKR